MTNPTRRQFLETSVGFGGALALGASVTLAYDVGFPLAFQAHGLRVLMSQDFPGTLKKASAIGYRRVELVSFKGYSGPTTRDGFAALVPPQLEMEKSVLPLRYPERTHAKRAKALQFRREGCHPEATPAG